MKHFDIFLSFSFSISPRDGGHLWRDGGGELLHASGASFVQEETQEQKQHGELRQTQEAQVDPHGET